MPEADLCFKWPECPTFGLAWATLSEDELSWASYIIYNIVNLYKLNIYI